MPDEFVGGGNGGSLPLSVKDYGAKGDGVTDDITAIQACFDAAKAAYRPVYFPAPVVGQYYKITAAINISRRGQIVTGTSEGYCEIFQATAAEHAFNITPDTSFSGGTFNQHVTFENLHIQGVGAGTSTGHGVHAATDGDWLEMHNCDVEGFSRGAYIDGWAQTRFVHCSFGFNDVNLEFNNSTANNTIQFQNTGVSHGTTAGVYFSGGGGCAVYGGDFVEQPLGIRVGIGTGTVCQVTLIGGNFEAVTGAGTEFIKVNNGAQFASFGSQFQKVDGVDADAIHTDGGSVFVSHPVFAGMAATKAIVRKTNSTDIVTVINPTNNLSSVPATIADAGTSYAHAQFVQRADNSVPSAVVGVRGLIAQIMARDGTSTRDELLWFQRNRLSAADQFERYTLSRVMYGTGSPEGAVIASPGVLYVNDSGGIGVSLYVKETGNGNTGWNPVAMSKPFVAKTTTYTATFSDGIITGDATGGAFSVTLPTAASRAGRSFTIKKIDSSANAVTVATTSAQTIDGAASFVLSAQWSTVTAVSNGSNWLIVNKV